MLQPVLGVATVARVVGQHVCDGSQAEDAVGDQHGALVAPVDVPGDVLCARHQDAHVGVHLLTYSQPVMMSLRLVITSDFDVKREAATLRS